METTEPKLENRIEKMFKELEKVGKVHSVPEESVQPIDKDLIQHMEMFARLSEVRERLSIEESSDICYNF